MAEKKQPDRMDRPTTRPSMEEMDDEMMEAIRRMDIYIRRMEHAEAIRPMEAISADILHDPVTLQKQTTASASKTQQQTTSNYLRGVDVAVETTITFKAEEGLRFEWNGLRLHFPIRALPSHLTECSLHIRASLPGHIKFPDGYELVSAVYWISCSSNFTKPVEIDIQHCSANVESSSLKFVRVKSTPMELPYTFKTMDDGYFPADTGYGTISVSHFCGIGIICFPNSCLKINYLTHLYSKTVRLNMWKVYFVVTKNLDAIFNLVQQKFEKEGAVIVRDFTIEFEGDEIKFQQSDTENNFEIVAPYYPSIRQEEVRHFNHSVRPRPPKCEFEVTWNGREDAHPLPYIKFNFNGAKPPRNYCQLQLSRNGRGSTGVASAGGSASCSYSDQGTRNKSATATLGLDDRPTLPQILSFPSSKCSISLPQRIGSEYFDFGVLLLDDETGARVDALEAKNLNNPARINRDIFREWLRGSGVQPVTWRTLVTVLKQIGLSEVAAEIEKAFGVQTGRETPQGFSTHTQAPTVSGETNFWSYCVVI